MNENLLREFCTTLKTPSYVFDTDIFAERAEQVKKCFGDNVGLCFSIKANPFLTGFLPSCFDKIEVCSPGELTICEKIKADMSTVIFSGVNKTREDVDRAVEDGAGTFTAESLMHMRLINDSAIKHGITAPVLIRLSNGTQFGMDEQDALSLIKNRDEYKGVKIVGIHYFTGTQKRKPAAIEKELGYVSDFVLRVKSELGFKIERIEYGTGLAVDYFSDDAEALELERLEAVAPSIRKTAQLAELTVEMGRFFAAPCGFYFTKVIDVKNNGGTNYAICDGGLNQLKYDGQIQGMQIPEIIHLKQGNSNSGVKPWTLCGSLCTTADILARNAQFDSLEEGDILVFCRTGAYSVTEGMAAFLSREMPAVAAYSKKEGLVLLRKKLYTDELNTPLCFG